MVVAHPSYDEAANGRYVDIAEQLMPDDMSEEEQAVWRRMVPELVRLGRIGAQYIDTARQYCELLVRVDKFRRDLDENGWTYETLNTQGSTIEKKRPTADQYNDDWRKLRTLLDQMGLTPVSNLRFGGKEKPNLDDFTGI